LFTDGCADASASKCNGLVREKELEPWVGDGATNEDGLEAIEDSVVDGFDRNEVMCRPRLIVIIYERNDVLDAHSMVQWFLGADVADTCVAALVFSWLDYCSAVLASQPT